MSIAKNLHDLRRAAKLTQTHLGEAIGVGQPAVSKWERGEAEPSASDLPKIARLIGTSVEALLRGVDVQYDAGRGAAPSVQLSRATDDKNRPVHQKTGTITAAVAEFRSAIARLDEQTHELRAATGEALSAAAEYRRQIAAPRAAASGKSARPRRRD